MEVVDARLQRHGELEQVARAVAEEHRLGRPDPRDAPPQEETGDESETGDRAGRDRNRERGAHSVKMTGYSAVLLVVFVSPGTGSTSTLTVVCSPNGTRAPTANVTAFVSPWSMIGIVAVLTIESGCLGIVSVTLILTSWLSPVSSTPTSNLSSSVTLMVVSVVVERSWPLGRAFTYAIPLPCRPVVVPPV